MWRGFHLSIPSAVFTSQSLDTNPDPWVRGVLEPAPPRACCQQGEHDTKRRSVFGAYPAPCRSLCEQRVSDAAAASPIAAAGAAAGNAAAPATAMAEVLRCHTSLSHGAAPQHRAHRRRAAAPLALAPRASPMAEVRKSLVRTDGGRLKTFVQRSRYICTWCVVKKLMLFFGRA